MTPYASRKMKRRDDQKKRLQSNWVLHLHYKSKIARQDTDHHQRISPAGAFLWRLLREKSTYRPNLLGSEVGGANVPHKARRHSQYSSTGKKIVQGRCEKNQKCEGAIVAGIGRAVSKELSIHSSGSSCRGTGKKILGRLKNPRIAKT